MSLKPLISGIFSLVVLAVLAGGPSAAEKHIGKLKKGVYSPPAGAFTLRVPKGEGWRISDGFDASSRAGAVSLSDEFNRLHGILYAPIPDSLRPFPEEETLRVDALRTWFHDFAIPHWFVRVIPETTVLREEATTFDGMPAWLAVLDLPGGAAVGKLDLDTGTVQPLDSKRGMAVFARGDHAYVIMCEIESMSRWAMERKPYDPGHWNAFLEELTEFYRTIRFRTP